MRSIPGAKTKGMLHHTKGCIADCTLSIAILHHGTNDSLATSSPTETGDSIISLPSDTKKNVKEVMVSVLIIRNDKCDEKKRK